MSSKVTYNANLFALTKSEPLRVHVYKPTVSPNYERTGRFYEILGRLAKKLTNELRTAVISDEGRIKTLEKRIPSDALKQEIELENIGTYAIDLAFEETKETSVEDTEEYGRIVNRLIDLSLTYLSPDFYKFHALSPYILKKGDYFFDEALRDEIGVVDVKRYYRGIRVVNGVLHVIVNREIDLRSWKNLLNELKIFAQWFGIVKGKEIDFYNPPEDFVGLVNKVYIGKRAYVHRYSGKSIAIERISWERRAGDPIPGEKFSPCEYHMMRHGIANLDPKQPVVNWSLLTEDGKIIKQLHVPEVLVVGHTFRDLSMRVQKSKISQVFDILHPNCNLQQRSIYDFMKQVDSVLRNELPDVYPRKVQFSLEPKEVGAIVQPPLKIKLEFKDKTMTLNPPYDLSFYRKYEGKKFAKHIGDISVMVHSDIAQKPAKDFVEELQKEWSSRNDSSMDVKFEKVDFETKNYEYYDLVITISDSEELNLHCKQVIQNMQGILHQHITSKNATSDSVMQLVMQINLKLGGDPWLLKDVPEGLEVVALYVSMNPLTKIKSYYFNAIDSKGKVVQAPKSYSRDQASILVKDICSLIESYGRVLFLTSFDIERFHDTIIEEMKSKGKVEFACARIRNDALRLLRTYRPRIRMRERRRRGGTAYSIEAYEEAPQGVILKGSKGEYFLLPTASRKIGTYFRGCPTAMNLQFLHVQGDFDTDELARYILSLSMTGRASGHPTSFPSPLYYLRKYAKYARRYGLPKRDLPGIFYI